MAKTPKDLDLMALAATVQAGGTVDEEKLAREKKFTFILKGKRTFDIWAENEEEATELFQADEIFGSQKIIDVIEADEKDNVATEFYSEVTKKNNVKVVTEHNPALEKELVAEERKSRTIIRMVMNEDGTSSEVKEEVAAPKKRATKKK